MNYFVMVCEGKHPIMPILQGPLGYSGHWMIGRKVEAREVPEPLVYTLNSKYQGTPKAMDDALAIPVMRDDVAEVLNAAGVDHIQYFKALLQNPATGEEFRNYKAFNILGLVSCADLVKSRLMGTSGYMGGDTDFDSLYIDETKTQGALLFRLAENISAIVVHRKIKEALEASGIPGFVFYGPGEWSG